METCVVRSRFRLAFRHYERPSNHHWSQVILKSPNFNTRFNSIFSCRYDFASLPIAHPRHRRDFSVGNSQPRRLTAFTRSDLILNSSGDIQLFWLLRQIVNTCLQIFRLEHSHRWKDFPSYRFGSWRQVTTTRVWEDAGAGVVVCRALGSSSCDGHVEEEEYQLGPSVAQQGAGYTFQSSKLSCSLKSGRS